MKPPPIISFAFPRITRTLASLYATLYSTTLVNDFPHRVHACTYDMATGVYETSTVVVIKHF